MRAAKAEMLRNGLDPDLLVDSKIGHGLSLPLPPNKTWFMYFPTASILGKEPEDLAAEFCQSYLKAQKEQK